MDLDRSQVDEPDQRREIVDHAVEEASTIGTNIAVAADPLGSASGLVLLPPLLVNAGWESPRHHRPVSQVGEKSWGQTRVGVQHPPFGESLLGPKHAVEVGQLHDPSVDGDVDRAFSEGAHDGSPATACATVERSWTNPSIAELRS